MHESPTSAEQVRTPEGEVAVIFEVMRSPAPFDERQMRCIELAKRLTPEQKIAAFEAFRDYPSPKDRESLASLTNVSDLLGYQGNEVEEMVGDAIFDKIMNLVIISRLKNVPEKVDDTLVYQFTAEQEAKLLNLVDDFPVRVQCDIWQIVHETDFLYSPVMSLREHAKFMFSVINVIDQYFDTPKGREEITPELSEEIHKKRSEVSSLIGYMNNLKFR